MNQLIAVSLASLLFILVSCKEDNAERAKSSKSGETAAKETAAPDAEDENADMPVQISGAFLTTEFVTALPDKQGDETSLGGRIEKDGAKVAIADLNVSGKVINTTTGEVLQEFTVADQSDGNQFSVNIKDADMPGATVKLEVSDAQGKKGSLGRPLADHSGTVLTSIDPDKMFDFSNLTAISSALTAKNYCNESGPMASVMKSIAPGVPGVNTPLATMSEVAAITLAGSNHCFVKVSNYTGNTASSLLGPNERIGDYVGSGMAQGGSTGCMFIVMKDSGSGSGDSKPKLYVFKDHSAAFLANMRKTAFSQRCP